ncbi:hypothetical protein HU200_048362 [Digitaria exilis]|uniref:non-specific serine/threonine protein kinase n=2 Tax=Paniceae TaxID=147428 RepID=A0A835E7S9_9POAL|nr:hypothetical protein HU200_048362 [Digitaria exilis]
MDRAAVTVGPGMDMPIMHDGDRYELVRDIGSGNFGVARLMRNRADGQLVAVKYIERGEKIDENVQREIINHRSLRHPNIIRFKEVILTPTHLAIVMEYASGGELFERICNAGRFSEDEFPHLSGALLFPATYIRGQLLPFHVVKLCCTVLVWSGLVKIAILCAYLFVKQVCHRDLKLENTLLDGSTAPRLKICDFGYSKSSVLHSQPKSTVGTPAYIAPEVLLKKEYDGKVLYTFLLILLHFHTISILMRFIWQRILGVQYSIPDYVHISPECQDLISRIFVANPATRITIPEIRNHPWFLKNLPADLMDDSTMSNQYEEPEQPMQSMDEIMQILAEATIPAAGSSGINQFLNDGLDLDDDMEDLDSDADLDLESSGEIVYAM